MTKVLHKFPAYIRFMNLYREGDVTHFSKVFDNRNVVPSWNYTKKPFDIKCNTQVQEAWSRYDTTLVLHCIHIRLTKPK